MPKKTKKKSSKPKACKSGKVAKKKTAKRKVGRPKRKFTKDQIEEMEKYALAGCQTNTIATLMGIPQQTLEDNFRELLTNKRCERKLKLREQQNSAAKDGSIPMLIFLGKNYLGQADKLDERIDIRATINIVDFGDTDDSE